MFQRDSITHLATHEVANQPPPLADYNLYDSDPGLQEALAREGGAWAAAQVHDFGAVVGSARVLALGEAANRHEPELHAFDRTGGRIDEVEFHPAWHESMQLGIGAEIHSVAWTAGRAGGHVAHAALEYMLTQAEAGVCCPITMTYAAIPALAHAPELSAEWAPRILSTTYDGRIVPAAEKAGVTIGMAMTEKQGGSDVRANTTRADPLGGDTYALTGHKWFCSAPMSDAFLTLAQAPGGLTCFLAPRWLADGSRNRIFIQRLKDKLGNRSNASAEIEYDGAVVRRVGEEGRGVATIMEMVGHTRLDAAVVCAGMMRQGAVRAVHHAAHRMAFGKLLIDQPLMKAVLADLVLEAEAALAMVMRLARAFDGADDAERAFARIAAPLTKFWVTKRLPHHSYEALECFGGNGYVEDSQMPRLYREAPVNAVWEGSGNVIALDLLRAMGREPAALAAYLSEVEAARGADAGFDRALDALKDALANEGEREARARRLAEDMALALQGALLIRHGPAPVAEAFAAARLGGAMRGCTGALPAGLDVDAIIARARVIG